MATPHVQAEPSVKLEAAGIKQEQGLSSSEMKVEPGFKAEPGYADDDELYEDAGDLDVSNGDRAVWLVKLPQFLAERWKDIDEDEEIVLGTVKVDRNAPDQKTVCMPQRGVLELVADRMREQKQTAQALSRKERDQRRRHPRRVRFEHYKHGGYQYLRFYREGHARLREQNGDWREGG